jgi:F-type H+-transporting ATPase subunit a
MRVKRAQGGRSNEAIDVDHHTNWFAFLPGYHSLHAYLNANKAHLVVYPAGATSYETVHHVFAAGLVFLFLVITSLIANARFKNVEQAVIPPATFGLTAFFELVYEIISGLMQNVIGDNYRRYLPMIGTCALFILFSNLLGLVPGFVPPTDNLNTTAACALVIFVWFNWHALRKQGIAYITHMANPVGEWWGWFLAPLMFPVELFGIFVRPVTLALRLAANMIGDHKVLFAFSAMMPILVPLPFYALGTMVCLIQTAVFCILSTVYIALHAEADDHH